uniref:Uncharacterized protein n=1 Tax=Arundo donax TaxID=35708 RepID=A0A0A9CR28_ARUDO
MASEFATAWISAAFVFNSHEFGF